ncbi:MarR family winged helix-turn-helix transcriptional regulator [Nocardioides sp.]|uniref:MarR family winged helix-turn-helix transcriptional regulator n=1 Tax=Nocardioides sp. TaxID=35761 RepID=UPI002ED54C38
MSHDMVAGVVEQWARERPDLDPSPLLVSARITRVAHLLDTALRPPFAAVGLGNGDFDVLTALRRAGAPHALRPVELSHQMLVTTGAVTKRVDRLVAQGYVDREATADDGRGKLIRLTASGLDLVDRMIGDHLANLDALLGVLSTSERGRLAGLLGRLALSLEE